MQYSTTEPWSGRPMRCLLFAAIGLILACTRDPGPLTIGAIIPLTGPASQHVVFVDAMNLAMEEVNASGGVNGRRLELLVEDSCSDAQEGVRAFERMEGTHHPFCYVSTTSAVSLALAPLAEGTGVVLTGMAAASPYLTKGRRWVFRYYVTPEMEAAPIVDHLQREKVATLGLLYQDDDFGHALEASVTEGFEAVGGRVVSVPFNVSHAGYGESIRRVEGMEAVYVVGFVRVAGEVIQALRAAGYSGLILSYSGASSLPQEMPEMMPQLEGVCLAAPIIYNPNFVFAQSARHRFETRYGYPFTHQAANGYDFVHILAGLLEGESVTRERLRELLARDFSYPGVFGYIEKGAGEHDITFPLYPARIDHGAIVYLP